MAEKSAVEWKPPIRRSRVFHYGNGLQLDLTVEIKRIELETGQGLRVWRPLPHKPTKTRVWMMDLGAYEHIHSHFHVDAEYPQLPYIGLGNVCIALSQHCNYRTKEGYDRLCRAIERMNSTIDLIGGLIPIRSWGPELQKAVPEKIRNILRTTDQDYSGWFAELSRLKPDYVERNFGVEPWDIDNLREQ